MRRACVFCVFLMVLLVVSLFVFEFGFVQKVYATTANFGYETAGSSGDADIKNIVRGSWFTGTAGTANNITAYVFLDNAESSVARTFKTKCAIYKKSDNSSVGSTVEWSISVAKYSVWGPAWYTFTFSSPPTIESIDYYLVIWGNNPGATSYPTIRYTTETSKGGYKSLGYTTNFPNPWTPTIEDKKCSIYCTYTVEEDTTPPTYSDVGTNTTVAGQPCKFYTKWTDETGLATTGGFIFGTNNTGSWINETWTAFTANPDWSNVTKTLSLTVGAMIEWEIWANDTSNNWNNTGIQIMTALGNWGSSVSLGLRGYHQRNSFYAKGLFWVYAISASYVGFKTSSDGYTWSSHTQLYWAIDLGTFSLDFDGTYVHYSYCTTEGNPLYYRRGEPQSNGTITYSTTQQTVMEGVANIFYLYPTVAVSSSGYPFIGYFFANSTGNGGPYVVKSSLNNGSWVTDGSAFQLYSLTGDPNWRVVVCGLSSDMMYVEYSTCGGIAPGYPFGRLWDGTNWSSQEQISANIVGDGQWLSLCGVNQNVHFVFRTSSPANITYNERVYGVGWGTETVIAITTAIPQLSYGEDGKLYCFWSVSNGVVYKVYNETTWSDSAYFFYVTTETIGDYKVSEMSYGGYILFVYRRTTSPYNIRFAYLTITVANTDPVINQLRLSLIIDTTNITSITVNTWYDWEANVTDADTLNDLVNVTIRIANNPPLTITADSPSYNESSIYWFRYLNSTDIWEWYSGSAWTATSTWLDVANCSYPTKTGTNGWYLFRVKLSKVARYSSSWQFATLTYDSILNTANKAFVGISIAKYTEMEVITTEHHWTNILVGSTNVLIDEGTIRFNVSCNYQFDVQARGNDSFARSNGYTIGIGNITIHKDTLGNAVSLTIGYVDVGGLTNLNTYTSNFQYSFKLWISIPEGTQPWQDYKYECEIQITSS